MYRTIVVCALLAAGMFCADHETWSSDKGQTGVGAVTAVQKAVCAACASSPAAAMGYPPPCTCTLWPIEPSQIPGEYLFYVEKYLADDPECTNPIPDFASLPDTTSYPNICPDCDIEGATFLRSTDSDFSGIPAKVQPGHSPDFASMKEPNAKKLSDTYIEFTNPSTLRPTRAQISFFQVDPEAAKKPVGTTRIICVGYELDPAATPPSKVFRVPDRYVRRPGTSKHVLRVGLGSAQALVLLAK